MRTVLFTTSFWNDSESAQRQEIVDPVFGLRPGHARSKREDAAEAPR